MAGVNKVILVGNLGRDPEVRTTQNGTKVANFSVATSESWTDKASGERKEQTEWHKVVVWDKLAEIVERFLRKGSKVYLEGKLQTRKWTDQSGAERYSTEIVVQGFNATLQLLDAKGSTGGDDGREAQRSGSAGAGRSDREKVPAGGGDGRDPFDDDIPF